MDTTQLYYDRILDTFIEEYQNQLLNVKEGHCMKVVGLPFDVLENLYDKLQDLHTPIQIYILSDELEGSKYISATKLIELRNDLSLSILVLIPVNVSTAAEDSYGNATFKELSIAHLHDGHVAIEQSTEWLSFHILIPTYINAKDTVFDEYGCEYL